MFFTCTDINNLILKLSSVGEKSEEMKEIEDTNKDIKTSYFFKLILNI